eukprot:9167134-Ditylum_brightwellii.AAC.1
MDTMLVSVATSHGQKKLCHWITFARYTQHFIQNLVTVGRQETSVINLGTSSYASITNPGMSFTLEETLTTQIQSAHTSINATITELAVQLQD